MATVEVIAAAIVITLTISVFVLLWLLLRMLRVRERKRCENRAQRIKEALPGSQWEKKFTGKLKKNNRSIVIHYLPYEMHTRWGKRSRKLPDEILISCEVKSRYHFIITYLNIVQRLAAGLIRFFGELEYFGDGESAMAITYQNKTRSTHMPKAPLWSDKLKGIYKILDKNNVYRITLREQKLFISVLSKYVLKGDSVSKLEEMINSIVELAGVVEEV